MAEDGEGTSMRVGGLNRVFVLSCMSHTWLQLKYLVFVLRLCAHTGKVQVRRHHQLGRQRPVLADVRVGLTLMHVSDCPTTKIAAFAPT